MDKPIEFYNQAIEIIENSQKAKVSEDDRFASGETKDIVKKEDNKTLAGRPVQIWLKNEMGQIIFTLFLRGKTLADNKYYSIKLAHSVPVSGWSIVTTKKQYLDWRFTTVKTIGRL